MSYAPKLLASIAQLEVAVAIEAQELLTVLAAESTATAEGTWLSYGFGNESLHFISYFFFLHWENNGLFPGKEEENTGEKKEMRKEDTRRCEKIWEEKNLFYLLLFINFIFTNLSWTQLRCTKFAEFAEWE